MAGIFTCYRREDSPGHAGRLIDRLKGHFGSDAILIDIDVVEPGIDWVDAINTTVSQCDVILVVIGPNWLTSVSTDGIRSIDDPEDYVHLEVATVLSQSIRIIPVLVAGATMPASRELPEDLRHLARRRAHELTDKRWDYDVGQLILLLERVTSLSTQEVSIAAEEPVESETADNADSQQQLEEPYVSAEEPVESKTEDSAAAQQSSEEPYNVQEEPVESEKTDDAGATEQPSGEKRRLSAVNVMLSIVAAVVIAFATAAALEHGSLLLISLFYPRFRFSLAMLLVAVLVSTVAVWLLIKRLGHRAMAMTAMVFGSAIDLIWGAHFRGAYFALRVLPDVLLVAGVLWIWHRLRRSGGGPAERVSEVEGEAAQNRDAEL